jgi:hypothetical protein
MKLALASKASRRGSIWTTIPWQAFALAALLMPALGVITARQFLAHRGPRAAQASLVAPPTDQALAAPRKAIPGARTASDATVVQTLEDLAARPFAASPLAAHHVASIDAPAETVVPIEIRFTGQLTSILETPQGSIALIAGKTRRVGDLLGNTWQLASLDPDAGTATLKHGTGAKQVLTMRRNLENIDKR